MQRRRFTPEYKQEALQLAQKSDIPISQVAKNPGINDNVLRRWIKEFTDPSQEAVHGPWKSTRRGDGRSEEGASAS
jgi:transposase